ncbi:hypothetical protein [Desulfosporosinus fructosivorans]
METYFHNDPRIRKWINQIIERIFTVCILTGVDSDEEFQKGCQIVMKLTSLLQDTPNVPAEFLADGVKQLLEQQLPDARVINNFPVFQDIMDRMLREGILKATDTLKKENFHSISDTVNTEDINLEPHDVYTDSPMEVSYSDIQYTKVQARADAQAHAEALAQAETQARADAEALAEALAQAETQARADAQALAEALAQAETQARADAQALAEALAQAEIQARADAQALAEALAQAETHRVDAQALAEALAQAEIQARADAEAHAEALAQAETQARVDAQAHAEALAQAEIQARADAEAHAEALAQAETQARVNAQAHAEALAQVETHRADALAHAEALAQAETQARADAQALAEALAQAETHRADAQALAETLAQAETQARADAEALTNALAQVNALTNAEKQAKADSLAIADALAQVDTKLEAIIKIDRLEHAPKANNTSKTGPELEPIALIKVPALLTSINSKISQVFSSSLVPHQADLLRKVLSNIFPKGIVYWNKKIMGQTFLAQVEDILICLQDPEHPCNLNKFNKDGWKVLVCSDEDLTFPRRLEREIRQIQRSGKMSATV